MPELPEVQTVVNTLRPALAGRRIQAVRLLRTDILLPAGIDLAALLTGRKILDISRRGKKIIFTLDGDGGFYVHLGISGRIMVVAPNSPIVPHTHLLLDFAEIQFRFIDPRRFGGIFWLAKGEAPDDGLGPEPLTLKVAQLSSLLAGTSRAIKNVLLDQTVIAGLGNIYADESLFTARIHPLFPANKLGREQISRLNLAIKQVLRKAINHRGSTLRDYRDPNDEAGNFQHLHRVYHRTGKPCLVCKTAVMKIVMGGRSTHFCPKCQPRIRKSPDNGNKR
jgi:formamidopyrimidine-DNA glycosylase